MLVFRSRPTSSRRAGIEPVADAERGRSCQHRGAFDRPIVAGRAFHRADRSPANLREALQHTFRIGGETWGDRCTCSGEICLRFEDQKVLKSTLLCAFLSASVTACP